MILRPVASAARGNLGFELRFPETILSVAPGGDASTQMLWRDPDDHSLAWPISGAVLVWPVPMVVSSSLSFSIAESSALPVGYATISLVCYDADEQELGRLALGGVNSTIWPFETLECAPGPAVYSALPAGSCGCKLEAISRDLYDGAAYMSADFSIPPVIRLVKNPDLD